MKLLLIIYISWLVLFSLITLVLYKKDKAIAIKKTKERIKEKTLLGFTAMGGAFGAFIGRILFHHKTDKVYFSIVIYLSLLLEVIGAVGIVLIAYFI